MLLELIVLVILIVLSAFFSGSEIALFSLSNIKLKKLLKARKRGARTLKKLKARPHRLLVTILIGNNIVNIGAASLATLVITEAFGSSGIGIAIGIMTFLILVFGEITPKSFFHQKAEKMSLLVARPLYVLSYILYPVIVFLEFINRGILRIGRVKKAKDEITEEEIMAALSLGAEAGVIEKEEEEMIENIIDFGDSTIKEVMTPIRQVATISSDKKLMHVITKILETKYSRIPVYRKNLNNIIGIVNLRSILKYVKRKDFDTPVEKLIYPVIHVRENDKLDDVFDSLKENATHMAIVLGRDKKVKGIVTMEDLLEEIVGEIYDESDIKRVRIHFINKKTAMVSGGIFIKDLQEKIGIPLKGKTFTISDVVSARFNNRPKRGRKIELKNFILTVMEVDRTTPSKIKRIKIVKKRGKIRK
jgi:CBS domain containing-hemolysin-like protein